MKTYQEWNGIKGYWYDDPYSPDGRRWVVAKADLKALREYNLWKANHRCEKCKRPVTLLMFELHHVYGRGGGGGKREDRRSVCGIRFTRVDCKQCHAKEVIKRPDWGGKDFAKTKRADAAHGCLPHANGVDLPLDAKAVCGQDG